MGGEQLGDLVAQVGAAGERERGQQPEADGLAVAVARVAGDGLDRVADRVAEVEDLALAGVALVARHDPQLHARAREHEVAVGRGVSRPRTRRHSSPPAIRPVLITSAQPAASSSGGSVASVPGSTSTAAGWW